MCNIDEEEVTIISENEIGEHPKNLYILGSSEYRNNLSTIQNNYL